MKILAITIAVFLLGIGGVVAFYGASGPGQEYDLKLVVPVDARQIPKAVLPSPEPPLVQGEGDIPASGGQETRAEAGASPFAADGQLRPDIQR